MTNMMQYGGFGMVPGIGTDIWTSENSFYWENLAFRRMGAVIDGATRDTGNTGYTDILRPGLLLGKRYSTNEFAVWDPTATDGCQFIAAILDNPAQKMTDANATSQDRQRSVLIQGTVKPERLLIAGQSSYGIVGNTYEYLILRQLQRAGFLVYQNPLTTSLLPSSDFLMGCTILQAVTADRTLVNYESGSWFTNRGASGAVVFTLPASPKLGVWFRFSTVAGQTLTITAGTADTMIVFNDATADSVSFGTSSAKIGAGADVVFDGTGWIVRPTTFTDGTNSQTITLSS